MIPKKCLCELKLMLKAKMQLKGGFCWTSLNFSSRCPVAHMQGMSTWFPSSPGDLPVPIRSKARVLASSREEFRNSTTNTY